MIDNSDSSTLTRIDGLGENGNWIVNGAVQIASRLGVSESLIGQTIGGGDIAVETGHMNTESMGIKI